MPTQSLQRFCNLSRGKSLAEYSLEFETRLDEAADRADLQLNNVGRFFLFFHNSGLGTKTINDVKLQVGGDYNRFADARQLALRLSPNRHNEGAEIFYQDGTYDQDECFDPDGDWWAYYKDDGWYGDEEPGTSATVRSPGTMSLRMEKKARRTTLALASTTARKVEKGKDQDGWFNCGSQWHQVADCPLACKSKSKGKGNYWKGKGFGGKTKSKGWSSSWRPSYKGSYKGKKGFGKGKYGKTGKKGYGRFGKGSWFSSATSEDSAIWMTTRGLDIADGIADSSAKMRRHAVYIDGQGICHPHQL